MREFPEKISLEEFRSSADYILKNILRIQERLEAASSQQSGQTLSYEEIQSLHYQKSLYFTELGSLLKYTHEQCSEEEWEHYLKQFQSLEFGNLHIDPAVLEEQALPEVTEQQKISDLISQRVVALRKQVNVIMAMAHFQGRARGGLTSPEEQVPQDRETMIRIINVILRDAEDPQCSLEDLRRELNFLAEFWASKENPFYDLSFLNNPTISPAGLKKYQADALEMEKEMETLLEKRILNGEHFKKMEDEISNLQEKLAQKKAETINIQLGLALRKSLARRLLYEVQIHPAMASNPALDNPFLRIHSLISEKVYSNPKYTLDLQRMASQDAGQFQQEVVSELEKLVRTLEATD